jgi:hypothetical protein
MTLTNTGVKLKFFLGCLLTADIELRLNQSFDWKDSKFNATESNVILSITHFQEKKYLGFYLDRDMASLAEFKDLEKKIRNALNMYCKDLPTDSLNLFIFSQIFII